MFSPGKIKPQGVAGTARKFQEACHLPEGDHINREPEGEGLGCYGEVGRALSKEGLLIVRLVRSGTGALEGSEFPVLGGSCKQTERRGALKPSSPCQGTTVKGLQWVRPLNPMARQSLQLQNRGPRHQGIQYGVGGRAVCQLLHSWWLLFPLLPALF